MEFPNSPEPPGCPPHNLILKEHAPINFQCNFDPPKLCNGTRLTVKNYYIPHTSALFVCVVVGVAAAAPQDGGYSYQAPSAPSSRQGGGQFSGGPSSGQGGGQFSGFPSSRQGGGQYSGGPSTGQGGGQFSGFPSSRQGDGQYSGGPSSPAQYNFQWDVNDASSGNFYGHQEQRDGDNTQGSYYVQLPDSRLMRVEYYADQTGYHPTVTFEGEAQYPTASAPGRSYSPPAPASSYSPPSSAPAPTPSRSYTSPAAGPRGAPSNLYSAPGK
ncbi:hypothetical protein Pcinc_029776 [Petrolisthes cinctipes]|uniref:DNA helicase Pif1-like 2B domain-containing protein n=1 Tax=Petrolisthes cinctipes TaxID=88211 RepID=A0AAE1K6Y8_PETCI|nr:hypothetical protein Pcinc_029776 [Petrolisthes cinctipes]